ncbi:MAG: MBL fold metallo-hydrolase [Gemmatimonadetes bacterium]|nr:MBL fold metallo-hydrolase [Gemmatimonadota bacterium]
MLFERFEDTGLSQYSYAVGCPAAGTIAIVDPRRDVDAYIDFAEHHGVEIRYVLETHIHADFASGARELGERTGAELYLSRFDADERYEVAFDHQTLDHGDSIEMGSVKLTALHTPGHRPEHLSYLVFDMARSNDTPQIMLSGDFVFVGSVGRPDLLGEDAKLGLAKQMFHSIRDGLKGLPSGLEVHPGHGAGSMCGAGMSARPLSTLGFERVANPYLDPNLTEQRFVEQLLASSPPFPPYYRRMKELNSAGPPTLKRLDAIEPLPPERFQSLAQNGHVVVDVRDHEAFGRSHVPDAFGISVGQGLSTWAAWAVPYDTPLLLVVANPAWIEGAVHALARVGLDDVRGYLDGGMEVWAEAGFHAETLPQISVSDLSDRLASGNGPVLLDVRSDEEWDAGHVAGATHIMVGYLADRLDEIPVGEDGLAVMCRTSYRSTVAASILQRSGFADVTKVRGGISAWIGAGLPTTTH